MNSEQVFIGVPAYGNVTPWALPGLVVPTRTRGRAFTVIPHQDSLLAKAFNHLVCRALNEMKRDGWTHFVLHHADISCEIGWLDKLLAEYYEHDLDVISAVVAIKDDRNVTSTVVKSRGGASRYVTVDELKALPTTLGIEVVDHQPGDVLLVNSGLMLFDLRKPWVRKWMLEAPFTIKDTVVVNPETGDLVPRTISEDWGFSVYCLQHGIKVKATQAVAVDHHGGKVYQNR